MVVCDYIGEGFLLWGDVGVVVFVCFWVFFPNSWENSIEIY